VSRERPPRRAPKPKAENDRALGTNLRSAPRDQLPRIEKIVSGGQTGVDRAALDVALVMGIECGGWCPKGRRAEDGRIPSRYPLAETESAAYSQRTKRNVRDSDATLILVRGKPRGGTLLTQRAAAELGKPCLAVDLDSPAALADIRIWLRKHAEGILNVAGPRESQSVGITLQATRFLQELLAGRRALQKAAPQKGALQKTALQKSAGGRRR
jgi:Circularly permutated YpsA SLOG family